MSSLLKITALCTLSTLALAGCTTHTMSNIDTSNTKPIKMVHVHQVSAQGVGQKIGTVLMHDSPEGLVIRTDLKGLPNGERGFHIHENHSCEPAMKDGKMAAAMAAGGHLNSNQAPNHGTPMTGHLGDLPALKVAANGTAKVKLIAPRLTLADVQGRSIMIHAGGDNYADTPQPLGGGGERIACGVS